MTPPQLRLNWFRFDSHDHLEYRGPQDLNFDPPILKLDDDNFYLNLPAPENLPNLGASFWRYPGLLRPLSFAGAPVPPAPAPAAPQSPLRELLLAIESLDATLAGMDSNGGVAGCRYSEVVNSDELATAKCNNQFKKGTKATARLEIRPLKGMDLSEIYRFFVEYDKLPGRAGINVAGFYLTHPGNAADQGSLDATREDPFESGKDFRKSVKERALAGLTQSVEYYAGASQLVMRPQGWLHDSSVLANFDITKGVLMSSGLIDEKIYQNLGIGAYQVPRRIDQFYDLFSQSDGCYPKRPGAKVVQPNFINDLPPLIEWLGPESIEVDIILRHKTIPLGELGSLTLGKSGSNRIKIKGDSVRTLVEVELKDLSRLDLKKGDFRILAEGLKAGKIVLSLPPLKEIAKEMGWLDVKKAADVIQACLGNAKPEVKVDHSDYLKKLFAKIELQDIHADRLEITHASRGSSGVLTKADIKSLEVIDLKALRLKSVSAESLVAQDPESKVTATLKSPTIDSLIFSLDPKQPLLKSESLKVSELALARNGSEFKIVSAEIQKLGLGLATDGKFTFSLEGAKSGGSVLFSGDELQLNSRGKSQIALLTVQSELKAKSISGFTTEMVFSGTIDEFSLSNAKTGHFSLKDTVFGESRLTVTSDGDPAKPTPRIDLDLAVDQAKVEKGHINFVDIGASTLDKGKIYLSKSDQGLSLSLQGKLDLRIPVVEIPLIEFLTNGLRIKGTLKDIRINGTGRLELGPREVQLSRDSGATLGIEGTLWALNIEDKPSERSEKLKGSFAGKVVESNLLIDSATVKIQDLEKLHFIKGNKALGIKPELKNLVVSDFGISDIQAGGKIWAKFPIFGWLLGKFPKIGRVISEKDASELISEIRFDSLKTREESDGRYTELNNFLIQIFEVDGRKQWAKFKLPLLSMTPGKIETGKEPIELEVYFKDKDRGGDFKFELKDEDLSGRRRRKADQP